MLWKSCRLSALLPRVLGLLLELGAGRHPAEQCAAWSVWLTFGASVRSPEALDCVPQFPQVSNEGRDSICLPGGGGGQHQPPTGRGWAVAEVIALLPRLWPVCPAMRAAGTACSATSPRVIETLCDGHTAVTSAGHACFLGGRLNVTWREIDKEDIYDNAHGYLPQRLSPRSWKVCVCACMFNRLGLFV